MLARRPQPRELWRRLRWLVGEFRREWSNNRIGGLSAEIAFFAILGLFPALLVFAAALGSLDAVIGQQTADSIETWLLERITDVFGTENTLEQTAVDLFDRSSAGLITVGLVLAAYASSRGFVAVVRALDVAYNVEDRRNWISTRVVGYLLTAITLVVASLMAAMVVVGPLLGTGDELAEFVGAGSAVAAAWVWLRWPAVFVVVIVWTAAVYRFVPRRRASWRSELPGALLGTAWWLVVSAGFRMYLDVASSGVNIVFGLLGGALSLLLWLYLLAMGLLVGALLNSVLARRGAAATPAGDGHAAASLPSRL